jgi:hypothetical protein
MAQQLKQSDETPPYKFEIRGVFVYVCVGEGRNGEGGREEGSRRDLRAAS